jgi:hypothetical protein
VLFTMAEIDEKRAEGVSFAFSKLRQSETEF